jgi:hypothetical protein
MVYIPQTHFAMARRLNATSAGQSLTEVVAAQGAVICQKYGPQLGWDELLELLDDRTVVRYPCEIRFEADPLLPGEFAHPVAKGTDPKEGFTIYVHPFYANQLPHVPLLVLYQLALINYGESATAEDAETFGSLALGLSKDDYYQALCELSSQIGGDELV